jgi:dTDP-glucose pyrophosphorylase
MEAIICVAGQGGRSRSVCDKFGFRSKCLLPLAKFDKNPQWRRSDKVILDNTILQLLKAGVQESGIVIVTGEHNHSEIDQFLTIRKLFDIRICIQQFEFTGTTAAVLSGMKLVTSPFYLSWSDMLFRLPLIEKPPTYNLIYTTSVSHQQSKRFDGIICAARDVLAISPKAVYKPGPFLMNTGVYFLHDLEEIQTSVDIVLKTKSFLDEIPIELVIHDMLSRGVPFKAESLDYLIDLGTSEDYIENMSILYGDNL